MAMLTHRQQRDFTHRKRAGQIIKQTVHKHLEDSDVRWHIQHGLPVWFWFYARITGLEHTEEASDFMYLDFRKILPSITAYKEVKETWTTT